MATRVFVYGALRKGASHAWRMERALFLGGATVKGILVKVDWYPGLVLEGETLVKGEVYEVDAATLQELDAFEGIGIDDQRNDEYERVTATVQMDDGSELSAAIYQWQLGTDGYEVVRNGDWLTVSL